jgi:hypothetical protein
MDSIGHPGGHRWFELASQSAGRLSTWSMWAPIPSGVCTRIVGRPLHETTRRPARTLRDVLRLSTVFAGFDVVLLQPIGAQPLHSQPWCAPRLTAPEREASSYQARQCGPGTLVCDDNHIEHGTLCTDDYFDVETNAGVSPPAAAQAPTSGLTLGGPMLRVHFRPASEGICRRTR